jgi:predicted nucleic acid-binding protein
MHWPTASPWNGVWHSTILDLIRRYPVTFCDASHHALPIVVGGQFVTADEQYLQRAAEAGHLVHLKDWGAT